MASNVNGLTAIETLALSKATTTKGAKEARAEIKAGEYTVNKMIRLRGTVKVGEDYEQNKTASMPQQKMLIAALKLNGVSIKAFMRQYLDGAYEVAKEDEAELKMIWDELADNFVDTFDGKVTTKLEVEGVEDVEMEAK